MAVYDIAAKKIPSFLVAGTHSGCGKTTVTLGLLAAFRKKGLTVAPFKCGPDFIDPTLHQLVTGRISRNLDPWMCGNDFVQHCFNASGSDTDLRLVEGVMGMFDGGDSSAASLVKLLGIPLLLVVDVRSAAESVAAVVKGFETFDPQISPAGVILNRVGSPRHLELLQKAIEVNCKTPVVGYLPREKQFNLPGRHLGLYMGEEEPLKQEAFALLADTVIEHVDLDSLLKLESNSTEICDRAQVPDATVEPVRIGVARDKAFCFYYEDNFDLLWKAGAELVFFSPLRDEKLPEDVDGLYFGGGYPELYANRLSANQSLCNEIRQRADSGGVIYAECGGFMYLTQSLRDLDNNIFEMASVFPVSSRMHDRRSALGYREVFLKKDTFLGPAGTVLRGHEFHYSTISDMPPAIEQVYGFKKRGTAGYLYKNVLAGYLHLHFGFSPDVAVSFVNACRRKKWL